jgi:putative radical SAM enzyme (TIGR03279 family)
MVTGVQTCALPIWLSPIYLSIHATEPEPRQRLLGIRRNDRLLEKIDFLVKNDIELHGQIVLCPGINDGEILRITLARLSEFHPGLRTISVVPVGLTKHREGLPPIRPVDPNLANEIVVQVEKQQREFLTRFGEPFVYLADELYIKAGRDIPGTDHYGDFWQIDNGVGMVRSFLEGFEEMTESFPASIKRPRSIAIITGMSATSFMETAVLPKLNRIRGIRAYIQTVPNRFFGETVTVSGLLTGQDVADLFQGPLSDETVVLPSNLLNADGLMLDDWTPEKLSKAIDRKVVVLEDFEEFWKHI